MLMKKLDINERILHLIEIQYNNNQKKFAESIGYSAQVVFNIVSGRRSKPSYDVLNAILSTNDNVSSDWLVTGKGSVLRSDLAQVISETDKTYKELAEARWDVIEYQKKEIARLERDLSEMKKTDRSPILYKSVAEPEPKLGR